MSSAPVSVTPDESIEACMKRCTEGRFRHLPVEQSGQIVGVISISDLIKAVIDDQATEIKQLQRYIISLVIRKCNLVPSVRRPRTAVV